LDTAGPLVATVEKLGKDEPDADLVDGTVQQALLFLMPTFINCDVPKF